jgi:iron complex transport system substrate-binding protein
MRFANSLRALVALLLVCCTLSAHAGDGVIGLASDTLPAHPKRVVVLEFMFAESLAALDLTPVGVVDPQFYPAWIGYDVPRFAHSANVGTRQQPSLEAIAQLKPDLIIGMSFRHASLFDALKRIAPTVLYEFSPAGFKTDQLDQSLKVFDSIAAITGRSARGAEVKRQLQAKLAEDRQRLAAAGLTGQTFTLLQELGLTDRYWSFTANSMAGGVARQLGLSIWPSQPTREGTAYVTTEQLLARPASDRVLLTSMSGPEEGLEAKFVSPVWRHVPARRAGHVALIERNIWVFGGPISAGKLADAITATLLKLNRPAP